MQKIAHLADIHIQDRRRGEYAEVFKKLYASLREDEPTLVVVAGDIFDNKMRASAHNLEDVAAFLTELTKIAPVVIIAGNHDTNCLTPGALDLLTPLVADRAALQPPNLTYWRGSGVYKAHGMVWTVIATDGRHPEADEEEDFKTKEGMHAVPHICLFHEEVTGALLPSGAQLRDFKLTKGSFDRYDLTMGGHIHLRQKITPRSAYCGSLVQQTIGEAHYGHGYVSWQLIPSTAHAPYKTEEPTLRGVDIKNDQGFVRVLVDSTGKDITRLPTPQHPRYWEMVHHEDAPPALVAIVAESYETAYGMASRAIRQVPRTGEMPQAEMSQAEAPQSSETQERSALHAAQLASRTLASHEEIIRELLGDSPLVESVLDLHRARWVEPAGAATGGKFRLIKLEFDNMYAFGPANVIDFTSLEGCVSGVVAPNHTGKSSLIEALVFALYEEHPRAPTKKDIIHQGAPSCRITLDFELDGKPGRITKGMINSRTHAGESQYQFEYAGENRTKGGTTDTISEITSVLGGAVNALASSFQLQGGENGGFIGTTPAGRKKLIASVMTLGSFETQERLVAKDLTACGGEVKVLEAQFRGTAEPKLELLLCTEEGDLDDLRDEVTSWTQLASIQATTAINADRNFVEALATEKRLQDIADKLSVATEGSTHSVQECESEVVGWQVAIGGEDKRTTPSDVFDAHERAPRHGTLSEKIDPESIAEKESAVQAARERITAAQMRTQEAINEVARNPLPQSISSELFDSASKSVDAAKLALDTLKLQPEAIEAPPEKSGGKKPAWSGSITKERSGPRPTDESTSTAAAAIAQVGKIFEADRTKAANFNAAAYKLAKTKVESYVDEVITVPPIPLSMIEAAKVEADLTLAKIELALLGPEAHHASQKYPVEIQAGATQETSATAICTWAASAVHHETIRGKLKPIKGCSGCEHAQSILAGDGQHLRTMAAKYQELDLKIKSAEYRKLAAISATAVEGRAAANLELSTLSAARTQYNRAEIERRATAVLEVANYWNARDVEARATHAERAKSSKRNKVLELEVLKGALEQANSTYEIAKAKADKASIAQRAHTSAVAAEVESEVELKQSLAAGEQAKNMMSRALKLREGGINSLSWWQTAAKLAAAAEASKQEAILATTKADEAAVAAAVAKAEAEIARTTLVETEAKVMATQQREVSMVREIARLTFELSFEQDRSTQLADAASRHGALKAYRMILRPTGGIGDRLLERGRAAISRQINEALRELGAKFESDLTAEYSVRIRPRANEQEAPWLPASLGSGYQKFVLSLATRLAVWRLSTSPRPDAFIIDEGFGACDDDYLESMASALESLASAPGGPKLVFLVSHVDILKARLERALEIEVHATGSRVANAAATIQQARPARPAVAAAADGGGDASALQPDPANASNVYCRVCAQSLRASWGARHLASAKHAAALKKSLV